MFHFFKYLLFVFFLLSVFNFFRSNVGNDLSLRFDPPFFAPWETIPLSANVLLLGSFCLGVLFAAALGALRLRDIRIKKKELRHLRDQHSPTTVPPAKSDSLPPLA